MTAQQRAVRPAGQEVQLTDGLLTSGEVSHRRVEAVTFEPMSDALRNHLVTLTYVELSNAMAELLGHDDANWCTLAVWPSLTVGHTIRAGRRDGLLRTLARLPLPAVLQQRLVRRADHAKPAAKAIMNRALATGNRGVFYEVGLTWTDFLATFGTADRHARAEPDWAEFERFSRRVLSTPAPPGRAWMQGDLTKLRDGYRAYLEAMHTADEERRAQLILLGNMCIGAHEQLRLQHWLELSAFAPIRRITRFFDDQRSRNRGIALFEALWTRFLTKRVFLVEMAGERLAVGRPLPPHPSSDGVLYPGPLATLHGAPAETFDRIVAAGGRGGGTAGAGRWTDIDQRMAFIVSLFRSRQRAGLVGINPYPADERTEIAAKAARIDRGESDRDPGSGLLFADMTAGVARPWGDDVDRIFVDRLEAARQRCDPEADDAVAAFYAASDRPPRQRHYTDVLKAINQQPTAAGPGPVARFRAGAPHLPEFADRELIARAQAFYAGYRTAAHIGLFYGSMPLSYAAAKGCQVLGLISTLSGDTTRRFWESARFVEDVFTTPFWEQDSAGYQSIRGVRLFHAAARSTIESNSEFIVHPPAELDHGIWDDAWGRPINQEDLLAATIDWSVATIHVMDRFAVPLDPEDARAYFHTWMVVGAMLGVEPELLASPQDPSRLMSLEEAQYAAWVMLERQKGSTVAGRRLMDGLLSLIDQWAPGPLSRLPKAMMHAALNVDIARVVGLPPPGLVDRAFVGLTNAGRGWRDNRTYRRVMRRVIKRVGERWLTWWEGQYTEVPPYRQGGHEAVEMRVPELLRLTIESLGEIEDIPAKLGDIPGIDVSETPGADGTRGLGFSTLIEVSSSVGSSLRETVRRMRDAVKATQGLQRAELEFGGKKIVVSALTDANIDALFPD